MRAVVCRERDVARRSRIDDQLRVTVEIRNRFDLIAAQIEDHFLIVLFERDPHLIAP